jgi:hypothetical protein
MALLEIGTATLKYQGLPEQVTGLRVTTNFLPLFGARTIQGRGFTAEDGAGAARLPAMVLTNAFWKSRFGGDPNIVGRKLECNGELYTVIGVLTPEFQQPLPADLYVPWPLAERPERWPER